MTATELRAELTERLSVLIGTPGKEAVPKAVRITAEWEREREAELTAALGADAERPSEAMARLFGLIPHVDVS